MAAEQERNREAWNLPRRPAGMSLLAPASSPDAARRDELATSPARHDRAGARHHWHGSSQRQDGLDWQGFLSRYFPGRRRHDLEALTAYGSYRSSRGVDEQSADEVARLEESEPVSAGSTAVGAWENEGGATP